MKVITLLNEKGGVGKTALAAHIGAYLAIQGKRVLMIDADGQAHLTVAYGIEKEGCFYDMIVRKAPFKQIVRAVPSERYAYPDRPVTGTLAIIPGNVETRSVPSSVSDATAVLRRVMELRDVMDYVIFDTSPSPSMLHPMIYMATDYMLFPTKCEVWSFDGLQSSMQHKASFDPFRKQYNLPEIQIMGIVPTLYRANTIEHSENLKHLVNAFGNLVWRPIPQRTVWTEVATMRQSLFSAAPDTKSAADAVRLGQRVMEVANVKA